MHYRLYYNSTGKIWGRDTLPENAPPMYPDATFILLPHEIIPDRFKELVDPSTLTIRPMTAAECLELNTPSEWELKVARNTELLETDWRESQPAWAVYRQALRDLPTVGDGFDMLNAWPLRPDGTDAIRLMRS